MSASSYGASDGRAPGSDPIISLVIQHRNPDDDRFRNDYDDDGGGGGSSDEDLGRTLLKSSGGTRYYGDDHEGREGQLMMSEGASPMMEIDLRNRARVKAMFRQQWRTERKWSEVGRGGGDPALPGPGIPLYDAKADPSCAFTKTTEFKRQQEVRRRRVQGGRATNMDLDPAAYGSKTRAFLERAEAEEAFHGVRDLSESQMMGAAVSYSSRLARSLLLASDEDSGSGSRSELLMASEASSGRRALPPGTRTSARRWS